MKAIILTIVLSALLISILPADDFMNPGPQKQTAPYREVLRLRQPARPDTAFYTFSVNPTSLLMSYYDYMIGSYNDLPLVVQPDPEYGGYFVTFHGQRTLSGQRRAFYSFINDNGVVQFMNELTNVQNREGFSSVSCDPVTGKPLYAWHSNKDADAELEIEFAYDAFILGAPGLISDPVVIVNNPITNTQYGSTNNEFIWPTVQIGPSPTAGMSRVYVLGRNSDSHTTNTSPSENAYIAYADFNGDMLETGTNLTWSYISIPTLDAWNHATDYWRRPNMAFTVGDDGRIYYVDYHLGLVMADDSDLVEPDLDAFVCDNYGEGTWERIIGDSRYPSWNPLLNYGNGPGKYFTGSDNITPVPDDSLYWAIMNSAHLNAAIDNSRGEIHEVAIWGQNFREVVDGVLTSYYHPSLQTVKDLVFDVNQQTFSVREIYPVAESSVDDLIALPWDMDGDGLVDEYFTNPDDPSDPSNGYPLLYSWWPFPYWDSSAHTDAMMFHYSNLKVNSPNDMGQMVAVWQDCNRARLYNEYPASYPELAPFADTPEIYISVSPDDGNTWSEPVSLNKVETPQFANIKPMWVYPADQVKFIGTTPEGNEIGKVGILFYDDISWGSYQQTPTVGQNDGGYVKYMELEFTFPLTESSDDPSVTPALTMLKQNYPNPFNPETRISFNLPKSGKASLCVYNARGQLVKTLVNGNLTAGSQSFIWNGIDKNGTSVASGLYYYKLNADGRTETRKMMLIK